MPDHHLALFAKCGIIKMWAQDKINFSGQRRPDTKISGNKDDQRFSGGEKYDQVENG